uniref:Uncharacterized protein n=1 Tax=Anguilla anguilla TaxID=7936 RepID=A0A0E9Q335_ANGAN
MPLSRAITCFTYYPIIHLDIYLSSAGTTILSLLSRCYNFNLQLLSCS